MSLRSQAHAAAPLRARRAGAGGRPEPPGAAQRAGRPGCPERSRAVSYIRVAIFGSQFPGRDTPSRDVPSRADSGCAEPEPPAINLARRASRKVSGSSPGPLPGDDIRVARQSPRDEKDIRAVAAAAPRRKARRMHPGPRRRAGRRPRRPSPGSLRAGGRASRPALTCTDLSTPNRDATCAARRRARDRSPALSGGSDAPLAWHGGNDRNI